MMRALWSAASGMIAQQTNVDTISNNIANVNTTGYKTEKTEFKSLLYQNLQARTTTANGANKPIPAQVGLGTRVASNTSMFTQGAMLASESDTAFAIDGEGFTESNGKQRLVWVSLDDDIKIYPEFFKTELKQPTDTVKHFTSRSIR